MNSFRRNKDSFYVILNRKYSFRRYSNPRSMDYEAHSLPLSYLTCWWIGIKVAYIKSQIICLQINEVYAIVTKWQIANNLEHNAVQKKSNISFHRCLFDKNETRKLQQEGIVSVFNKIFFRRIMNWNFVTSGYYYWKSTKLFASINIHIPLCIFWRCTDE